MSNKDYINIPMPKNDAGAKNVGEYLSKLLLTLWDEEDCFSGKRPFGNSGWKYEIYTALVSAGVVSGELDEDGYLKEFDKTEADGIVREIIDGTKSSARTIFEEFKTEMQEKIKSNTLLAEYGEEKAEGRIDAYQYAITYLDELTKGKTLSVRQEDELYEKGYNDAIKDIEELVRGLK